MTRISHNHSEPQREWPNQYIDARVVSFSSHRVETKPYSHELMTSVYPNNYYHSFQYYDSIHVEKAPLTFKKNSIDNSPLSQAYFFSVPNVDLSTTPLLLQTYTDIQDVEGYSQKELDAFWNSDDNTLLFVSLISLPHSTSYNSIVSEIKAKLSNFNCRVYFTFDSFDIVLFCKANEFSPYAKALMEICYDNSSMPLFVDSITVFGFIHDPSTDHKRYLSAEETFGTVINLCVSDLTQVKDFCTQLQTDAPTIQYYILLGRNDICIINLHATLSWLFDIHTKAKKDLDAAIVDINISILLPPNTEASGKTASALCGQQEYMEEILTICRQTCAMYNKSLEMWGEPVNRFYTNWLLESLKLVTGLYNNKLSRDIAVCLLPQYVNLLIYLNRYCANADLRKTSDYLSNCFSNFFFNINTLLECMNHSDKQFIHTLSYHSISFQMPAKIMAYYTAMTRYLMEVLHDDVQNFYGFTLSPRFSEELNVIPITAEEQTESTNPRDQFLSISIGEPSLYSLQHTTQVLTHEISHFVGDTTRNRGKRKQNILYSYLHTYLIELLDRVFIVFHEAHHTQALTEFSGLLNTLWRTNCFDSVLSELASYFTTHFEFFSLDHFLYSSDIASPAFEYINYLIDSDPYAFGLVCDWIWSDIFLKYINPQYFPILCSYWDQYLYTNAFFEEEGHYSEAALRLLRIHFVERVRNCTTYLIDHATLGLVCKPQFEHRQELRPLGYIMYLYRETFADVQAILLLNMSISEYISLLHYHPRKGKTVGEPSEDWANYPNLETRVLAVCQAMHISGVWNKEDIQKALANTSEYRGFVSFIDCNPLQSIAALGKKDINAIHFHYLINYLQECIQSINEMIQNLKHPTSSNTPRSRAYTQVLTIYESVSKEGTITELSSSMCKFIEEFIFDFRDILHPKNYFSD